MAFVANQLHVSRPLTDYVVSYDPVLDQFLRTEFFPRKPVNNLTNMIRQISKADLQRLYDLDVGAHGRAHEVQFRMDQNLSYLAKPYAAEAFIDALEAQDADAEVQYEQEQTRAALLAINNSMEYLAIHQVLRNPVVLVNNQTLTSDNKWDNYESAGSSPIDDLIAACQMVEMKVGKKVNRIGMSKITWNVLAQHPNVISRVTFDPNRTGQIIMPEILEKILDIEPGSIKITRATYNVAAMGEQATYRSFIGSDVVVARVEDPSIRTYGLGHEFSFNGLDSSAMAVQKYPDPRRGALGGEFVKVVTIADFKVTNPDAGFLLKTTLDTTNTARYGTFLD